MGKMDLNLLVMAFFLQAKKPINLNRAWAKKSNLSRTRVSKFKNFGIHVNRTRVRRSTK